jgi:hypothetical protein
MTFKQIAWIALFSGFSTAAYASSYCSKPTSPYCLSSGYLTTERDLKSCQSELSDYDYRVSDYVSCLEQAKSAVQYEQRQAQSKFGEYESKIKP